MRTIYYLDAENVGPALVCLFTDKIKADSTFAIFYSDNAVKMNMADLELLERHNVKVRYQKCEVGRNALDFQLITMLGYSIAAQGKKCSCRIISNDTGYDPAINLWKSYGYDVKRMPVTKPVEKKESKSTERPIELNPKMQRITKRANELRALHLSEYQAVTVSELAEKYSNEELSLRMNHIRTGIFSIFNGKEAKEIWSNSHNYLKKHP